MFQDCTMTCWVYDNICFNRLLGNKIGPDGAEEIADTLKVNKTLTELDLRRNRKIGPDEGKEIANALRLNPASSLIELRGVPEANEVFQERNRQDKLNGKKRKQSLAF